MIGTTSIIMLAYREPEKFIKSINHILQNTNMEKTPYEIIIVGNAPHPEIDKFIRIKLNFVPNVSYIYKEKNVGTSQGFNEGACVAMGHYVCFFNSDYYMMNNWLESMIECFNHKKNIGLISCSTNITGNKDEKIELQKNDRGYFIKPSNPPYLKSECAIAQMFTTKEIWREVGCFGKEFFFGFEDLDFNEKIKAKGYKIFVNGVCFGIHDHDAETKEKCEGHKHLNKSRKIFRDKWGDIHSWA